MATTAGRVTATSGIANERATGRAERKYRTALRLDPPFVPAVVNLADLDRARGMRHPELP
jgi:hypothetical protein